MIGGKALKWIWACLLLFGLLLTGCAEQEARLVYAPAATASPEEAQPTATPRVLRPEPIQGSTFLTDDNGVAITDKESHYFQYYVSFSNLRIYEEDGYCYLDAMCTNDYTKTLSGACEIIFFDEEKRPCGSGKLYTAGSDGRMILAPGTTNVYAEIISEADVSDCSFEIRSVKPFLPGR